MAGAWQHWRRIYTEENSKVVAVVWWARIYSIPCRAIAVLCHDDMKKRMNCTRMIWSIGYIHPTLQIFLVLARQGIESILSPKQQRRPLNSLLYLSFFYCRLNSSNDLCLLFCIYLSSMLNIDTKVRRGSRIPAWQIFFYYFYFLSQKYTVYVVEASFFRFWAFTVFVATASTAST